MAAVAAPSPWFNSVAKLQTFNPGIGAWRAACLSSDGFLFATGHSARPTIAVIDTVSFSLRDALPFELPASADPVVQALYCPTRIEVAKAAAAYSPALLHILSNDAIVSYDVNARAPLVLQTFPGLGTAGMFTGWAWTGDESTAYITTRNAQVWTVDMRVWQQADPSVVPASVLGSYSILARLDLTRSYPQLSYLSAPILDESAAWTAYPALYAAADPASGASELIRVRLDTFAPDGVVATHGGSATGREVSFRTLADVSRGFVLTPFRTDRAGSVERFTMGHTLAPGQVLRGWILNQTEGLDWGAVDSNRGYTWLWSTTLRGDGSASSPATNRRRWLVKVRTADFVVVGGVDLTASTGGRTAGTATPGSGTAISDFGAHSPNGGVLDAARNLLYITLYRAPSFSASVELGSEAFMLRVDLARVCPNDCSGNGVCTDSQGRCTCTAGWQGEDCSRSTTQPVPASSSSNLLSFPWPDAVSRIQTWRADSGKYSAMAASPDARFIYAASAVAGQPTLALLRTDQSNLQSVLNVSLPLPQGVRWPPVDLHIGGNSSHPLVYMLGAEWMTVYDVARAAFRAHARIQAGVGVAASSWAVDIARLTAFIRVSPSGSSPTTAAAATLPFLVTVDLASPVLMQSLLYADPSIRGDVQSITSLALLFPTTTGNGEVGNTSAPAEALVAATRSDTAQSLLLRWTLGTAAPVQDSSIPIVPGTTSLVAPVLTVQHGRRAALVAYQLPAAGATQAQAVVVTVGLVGTLTRSASVLLPGLCGSLHASADVDSTLAAVWSSGSAPQASTLTMEMNTDVVQCAGVAVLNVTGGTGAAPVRLGVLDLAPAVVPDAWAGPPYTPAMAHTPGIGLVDATRNPAGADLYVATSQRQSTRATPFAPGSSAFFLRVSLPDVCAGATQSCGLNGVCLQMVNGTRCLCDSGWAGSDCSQAAALLPSITATVSSATAVGVVEITSGTAGATLLYTTDGTDPASSSTVATYTVPFQVTGPGTVVVRSLARASGVADGISTASIPMYGVLPLQYSLSAAALPNGAVPLPFTLSLSASPGQEGATLRYTLDGTDPATSATSTVYTGGISVTAAAVLLLRAIGQLPGLAASPVLSVSLIAVPRLPQPSFAPAPGTYLGGSIPAVTIVPGAGTYGNPAIRFGALGLSPSVLTNVSGFTYSGPFRLPGSSYPGSTTLTAVAFPRPADEMQVAPSLPVSVTYTLPAVSPVVVSTRAPDEGTSSFYGSVAFTLSTTTPGAAILFTLNNTDPALFGMTYTGSITLSWVPGGGVFQSHRVSAYAISSSLLPSPITRQPASMVLRQLLQPPVPSIAPGLFNELINVTFTNGSVPQALCAVFVTLDGSIPSFSNPRAVRMNPGVSSIQMNSTGVYRVLARCEAWPNQQTLFVAPSSTLDLTYTIAARPCAVTDWSAWSACSQECGGGVQTRSRTVTVQPTLGATCPPLTESQPCNTGACTCRVGDWSEWSACTAACAGGMRSRSRQVVQRPTGGNTCPSVEQEEACNIQACTAPIALLNLTLLGAGRAAFVDSPTSETVLQETVATGLGLQQGSTQVITVQDVLIAGADGGRGRLLSVDPSAAAASAIAVLLQVTGGASDSVQALQGSLQAVLTGTARAALFSSISSGLSAALGTPVTVLSAEASSVVPGPASRTSTPSDSPNPATGPTAVALYITVPLLLLMLAYAYRAYTISHGREAQYRRLLEQQGHSSLVALVDGGGQGEGRDSKARPGASFLSLAMVPSFKAGSGGGIMPKTSMPAVSVAERQRLAAHVSEASAQV